MANPDEEDPAMTLAYATVLNSYYAPIDSLIFSDKRNRIEIPSQYGLVLSNTVILKA